jgi:Phage integrase family.
MPVFLAEPGVADPAKSEKQYEACVDRGPSRPDVAGQVSTAWRSHKEWKPAVGPNYLVYDEHRDAPTGFAIRVGKNASVFLVEKLVGKRKLKIPVALARGRKGAERPMDLATARHRAHELISIAKRHGVSPKAVAAKIEACELTLGQVWDTYINALKTRRPPIKLNSEKSVKQARDKFKDWEGRKVRFITADEVLARFDHYAEDLGYRTAAEAMGRWATAAVAFAIENEIHDAQTQGRAPSLTYNPFTILRTRQKYRKQAELERDYARKGIRNPLNFEESVGPYVGAVWEYRMENPVAADFLLLDLLWGLRGSECRLFAWRDQLTNEEAADCRWIDMKNKAARITDAKNRTDHEFPIGPCAFELLKLRRASQFEGERWVFPARSNRSKDGHYGDPSVAMKTVRERAGIEILRGHDLRRTFGGACEKLGFSDRQTKRMLGHGAAMGATLGRYTTPEWLDIGERMERVEELILHSAPDVYNALRPKGMARLPTKRAVIIGVKKKSPSRRTPR